MNGIEFLEKINDIDPDLIDMATRKPAPASPSGSKRKWVQFAVPAAVIVAAALLIIGISLGGRTPQGEDLALIAAGTESATGSEETKASSDTTSTSAHASIDNATIQTAAPDTTVSEVNTEHTTEQQNEQEYPYNDYEPDEPEQNDVYDDSTESGEGDDTGSSDQPGQMEYRVISIVWATDDGIPEAEEENIICFWEDDNYSYYMDQQILSKIAVYYENGEIEALVIALENGHIEITDLDTYGVPYYAE